MGDAAEMMQIMQSLNGKFINKGRGSVRKLARLVQTDDLDGIRAECRFLIHKSEPPGATAVGKAAKALLVSTGYAAPSDMLIQHVDKIMEAIEGFAAEIDVPSPTSPTSQKSGNNVFTDSVKVTNKAQIDLLSKQMAAHNMSIYNDQVITKFLEEELVVKLQLQRVQERNAQIHRSHQLVCERNQRWCESIQTPYTQRKEDVSRTLEAHHFATQEESPRFNDVERVVTPRLKREQLRRRGLPPDADHLARPVTPRTIAAQVRASLPPLASILNPVGRVPELVRHVDRQELLQSAGATDLVGRRVVKPKEYSNSKNQPRKITLASTLCNIACTYATWYDDKLAADQRARMQSGGLSARTASSSPRSARGSGGSGGGGGGGGGNGLGLGTAVLSPLLRVLEAAMAHRHGNAAKVRVEEMRLACLASRHGHGAHPRVALFRTLCWEQHAPGLQPPPIGAIDRIVARDESLMWIYTWLAIANQEPPAKEEVLRRLVLTLRDADRMIDNLQRKMLVPQHAKPTLMELAAETLIRIEELPANQQGGPAVVDADEMLLSWFHGWGSWDDDGLGDAEEYAASLRASLTPRTQSPVLEGPPATEEADETVDEDAGAQEDEQQQHDRVYAATQPLPTTLSNDLDEIDDEEIHHRRKGARSQMGSRTLTQPSWAAEAF